MINENNLQLKINKLKKEIDTADAIVIGAGAGLSTSAGFTYDGDRFKKYFSDFINKYHFTDMYTAGFFNFESIEEYWSYWSRYIYINRYLDNDNGTYKNLFDIVKNKNYFVITTNVDHQFQKAGFDKNKLFYMQGDYGLFQCSQPCSNETYDNEEIIKEMYKYKNEIKIPTSLIPKCPHCGRNLIMNLRSDDKFVEDEGWHKAYNKYTEFIKDNKNKHILFLELGVGMNTPGIIKFPFMQMTYENKNAIYAYINLFKQYIAPEIIDRSICIDEDINKVIVIIKNNIN